MSELPNDYMKIDIRIISLLYIEHHAELWRDPPQRQTPSAT